LKRKGRGKREEKRRKGKKRKKWGVGREKGGRKITNRNGTLPYPFPFHLAFIVAVLS
jgi:hypothetical protein